MAKHTFKILWCEHQKVFKVCLAIFQHYARKGLIDSRKLNEDINSFLQFITCHWSLYVPPEKIRKPDVCWSSQLVWIKTSGIKWFNKLLLAMYHFLYLL